MQKTNKQPKNLACKRAWPELLAGWEPWKDKFLCEQSWRGPSMGQTLCTQVGMGCKGRGPGPNGEVSCQICRSWGSRELQLIGIHQLGQIQGDLLYVCQCVPSGSECLVVYAALQGNFLACRKGNQLLEGQDLARRFLLSFNIGNLKPR